MLVPDRPKINKMKRERPLALCTCAVRANAIGEIDIHSLAIHTSYRGYELISDLHLCRSEFGKAVDASHCLARQYKHHKSRYDCLTRVDLYLIISFLKLGTKTMLA